MRSSARSRPESSCTSADATDSVPPSCPTNPTRRSRRDERWWDQRGDRRAGRARLVPRAGLRDPCRRRPRSRRRGARAQVVRPGRSHRPPTRCGAADQPRPADWRGRAGRDATSRPLQRRHAASSPWTSAPAPGRTSPGVIRSWPTRSGSCLVCGPAGSTRLRGRRVVGAVPAHPHRPGGRTARGPRPSPRRRPAPPEQVVDHRPQGPPYGLEDHCVRQRKVRCGRRDTTSFRRAG